MPLPKMFLGYFLSLSYAQCALKDFCSACGPAFSAAAMRMFCQNLFVASAVLPWIAAGAFIFKAPTAPSPFGSKPMGDIMPAAAALQEAVP